MSDRIRLTISVTPEVHALFSRMAQAAGISLSRAIGDWLQDTAEGAEFVAQKMEAARSAPRTVMREMQAYARGLVSEVDQAAETLRRASEGGKRSAPADARRTDAPSSNTGLNPPPAKGKQYSALSPSGERVLLPEGTYYGKDGKLHKRKPA